MTILVSRKRKHFRCQQSHLEPPLIFKIKPTWQLNVQSETKFSFPFFSPDSARVIGLPSRSLIKITNLDDLSASPPSFNAPAVRVVPLTQGMYYFDRWNIARSSRYIRRPGALIRMVNEGSELYLVQYRCGSQKGERFQSTFSSYAFL